MRYRYRSIDWKLILAVIIVVAIVIALILTRSALVEISGPKELDMKIVVNETRLLNATIQSQPGAKSYSNYSWHADTRDIFTVEETSGNFDGHQARFPLESGETRKLSFRVTLVRENPPEGRYFIDFYLESEVEGEMKRISNRYRLWIELQK
jgi:hypothetical protein